MKHGISKRILLVDDDVDLLMLLERILMKAGYVVDAAASLPEAEDIFPQFAPHLVLLDINIKGEDGRKLCWKLKAENPETKVIILSGYDYSVARAVLFGADDLIPKPVNIEYLLHQESPDNRYLLFHSGDLQRKYETRIPHRAIGVVYDPERERQGNYVPSLLAQRYDALIYLDRTNALHPLHLKPHDEKVPETYPFGY